MSMTRIVPGLPDGSHPLNFRKLYSPAPPTSVHILSKTPDTRVLRVMIFVTMSIADKGAVVNGDDHVFCELFFAQDRVDKALAIAS